MIQSMMKKFLLAKHWQIFILSYGIQFVGQILFFVYLFSSMLDDKMENDPMSLFQIAKFFPVLIVLYVVVYLGWIYSVSIGLQSKIPENIVLKVSNFKILFYIPIIYYALFIVGFSLILTNITLGTSENFMLTLDNFVPFLFPVHLFIIFCMLYIMYFAAKTYKIVELQREVKFSDFIGEFFLIWFFFVGVWILQPKINKIVQQ